MHTSPLASIKMSNAGSVHDNGFAPQLSVSHNFKQRPPEGSPAEAMPGHCQPEDELGKLLPASCCFLEPSGPLDVQIFDT